MPPVIEYTYDEGPIPFPDRIEARRGRSSPVKAERRHQGSSTSFRPRTGDIRRLTPRELELLNGFPGDWTAGMSDGKRAFMMGNALVVGLVERVANELVKEIATCRTTSRRGSRGQAAS